ncbi:hypothetical protein J3E72DRAFT_272497 [Bipolaris maydis]|nr:hypothetical protein J3E72DRAFT_272497 [Bipolaris maydis]
MADRQTDRQASKQCRLDSIDDWPSWAPSDVRNSAGSTACLAHCRCPRTVAGMGWVSRCGGKGPVWHVLPCWGWRVLSGSASASASASLAVPNGKLLVGGWWDTKWAAASMAGWQQARADAHTDTDSIHVRDPHVHAKISLHASSPASTSLPHAPHALNDNRRKPIAADWMAPRHDWHRHASLAARPPQPQSNSDSPSANLALAPARLHLRPRPPTLPASAAASEPSPALPQRPTCPRLHTCRHGRLQHASCPSQPTSSGGAVRSGMSPSMPPSWAALTLPHASCFAAPLLLLHPPVPGIYCISLCLLLLTA